MSPRSEEFMAMARDRMAVACAALDGGFPTEATSLAYYAMLYAARAALSEEDRFARTHSGTWHLFRETFVDSGRFEDELAGRAQATQKRREGADYDAVGVPREDAERILELAQRFLAAVAELVGE